MCVRGRAGIGAGVGVYIIPYTMYTSPISYSFTPPRSALVGVLGVALVLVYLTHASQQPGQGRQGRDGGVKMGGGKHF